ncbi:unnamed protein product [Heterobilharzia americana]|nr:unnamed protein product [Heterobilharzia americana]
MIKIRVALPTYSCVEQFTIALFNFKGPVKSITYDSLISKLRDFTRTKKGKFYVSWHDGTEYCTISTSNSLREAIVTMIYEREDKTPLIPENLPKDFRDRASRADFNKEREYCEPELPVTMQLICNVCNKQNWQGDRYTCVVCPKVVLCPTCFNDNKHSQHPILITGDNTEFPCPVVKAVKIVAADVSADDLEDDDYVNEEESVTSDSRPSSSSTAVDTDEDVNKTLCMLREMGFEQNTKELIELVRKEHGNLQTIIEKLAN